MVAVQEIPVWRKHVTAWIAEYAHAVKVVSVHTNDQSLDGCTTNTPFFYFALF
ncbi:hypothetical protein [Nitrosopumilus sp.]|uniref:hypothetical protein n=1 Tax=Nitrosopumilus sp. TaxID=2024843 RepID=UPI00292D6AE6|nr:hypothetical protein [Nitrosopumilus sp.]